MAKWFDTLFIGHTENTIHDLILYYNFGGFWHDGGHHARPLISINN